MSHRSATLERIGQARLVPVLRTADAVRATETAADVAAAGLDVIELTTTIPDWPQVLIAVRRRHPGLCVGVGTVLDPEDGRRAIDAGADFLVSPRLDAAVRTVAQSAGVLFLEGGLTPTELLTAIAANGAAKLFPAHVAGPDYLRSLLAVAPGACIVPTGGIRLADAPRWLAAGAFAVGVGRDLTDGGDPTARLQAVGLR